MSLSRVSQNSSTMFKHISGVFNHNNKNVSRLAKFAATITLINAIICIGGVTLFFIHATTVTYVGMGLIITGMVGSIFTCITWGSLKAVLDDENDRLGELEEEKERAEAENNKEMLEVC